MKHRTTEILWREEKYHVMFHSQQHYNEIRTAMRDKLPSKEIEQLIAEALKKTPTNGSMRNACQHMWGYFRKTATPEEKIAFERFIEVHNYYGLLQFLRTLAETYHVRYLLDSQILKKK